MPDRVHGRRSKKPIPRRRRSVNRLARLLLATALTGAAILATLPVGLANPKGGQVTAGSATISNSSPIQLDIVQSTNRAAIDWQSFDIAVGERTRFQQPSAAAMTLNRVRAADPSTIAGHLSANGSLVLINPNGIVFSKGSQVNVNSIIATPSDITNANFMAGNMRFDRPSPNPNASIVNAGTITVAQKGLAALVAPSVVNSGVIQARLGKVILAGAETFALDFYGDGLISFDVGSKVKSVPLGVDGKKVTSLVTNTGIIDAAGGTVLLTADAVAGILENVIDSSGQLNAQTTPQGAGTVTIDSGTGNGARLAGAIDVSGLDPGQAGGAAVVTGGSVNLANTAQVEARGPAGGGTVKIGGGPHGTDASVRNARKTTVAAGALIDASATDNGNGGNVTVWSDGSTVFNGTIYAKGGPQGGDGGWIETSGHLGLGVGATARVDALAPKGVVGTWVLDPLSITVATGGTGTLVQAADTADTTTNLTIDPATINAAAANVELEASTFVTFTNAVNMTNAGVALNVHAGGAVTVNASITTNDGDFTVQGFNGATSAGSFTSTAAINVGSANININTSGAIGLGGNLTTGTSQLVTLSAGSTISQTVGVVTTGTLTGSSVGGATLNNANLLTHLSTFSNTGAGDFVLTNAQTLNVIGAVDAGTGKLALRTTSGDLVLAAGLTAGTTVTLSSAGTISQVAGVITADTLTGSSVDGATLNEANLLTHLGAFSNTGTGDLALTNAQTLNVIGAVDAGTGALALTTTSGDLALAAGLTAGTTVTLTSAGTINQTAGVITADTLTGSSVGGATLNGANLLTHLDTLINTGTGDFALTNAQTLNVIGAVDAGTGALALTTTSGDLVLALGASLSAGTAATLTAAGTIALNDNVTTVGSQTYNSPVTLGNTVTLTTTDAAVHFVSTVDATTAGVQGLTVNAGAGTVTFGGAVGGTAALAGLDVTGPTVLNGNVTTSGLQTYWNAVTLGNTITVTATDAAVEFFGTVDATTAGVQGLTVNAGTGTAMFCFAVGETAALASLTVTGPTLLEGNVTTTGAQIYNGAVTLEATVTLTTINAPVTFISTVDAASCGCPDLTVDAGTGTVTFGADVGGSAALASLTVTGPTLLNGNVTTTGAQTYNSAVTLPDTWTLTTTNAAVDFFSTVDATAAGAQGLTVNAGTGVVTFGAAVGGTTPLAGLVVTGPTVLDANVTTNGLQTYNSAVTLGAAAVTLNSDSAGANGAITLNGQVTGGANSLVLTSGSGAQTLSGVITSGDLTLTTTGKVTLNGGTYTITGGAIPYVFPAVTTNGTLTLGQATNFGALTLGSDTTVNSTDTAIDFTSTVDATTAGVQGLTVNAGTGLVTFSADVGTTQALVSLAATGSTITLNGDVTTTGALTLTSTGSGSTLTLAHNLTAGTAATLNSAGTINQTAGVITAATLTGSSVGGASLTGANMVNIFDGFTNTGGGLLSFTDAQSFATAGTITSSGGGSLTLTTSSGDITLSGTETATNVILVSAGSITETPPIIASTLSVTAVGPVSMADANQVGTLAASVTGTGNSFLFRNDSLDLTIGTVGALSGITTNGGAVTLSTTTSGNIVLNQPIVASGATPIPTVTLSSAGAISQAAAGTITATSLSVTDSGGNAVLEAANAVGTVAASMNFAGGAFTFNDNATALTVGTVNGLSGITTSNGDINLKSGGLVINQPLNAGSGSVRLVDAGTISQTIPSPGTITAGALSISASGSDLVLELAGNAIGTVAVNLTTAGSAFTIKDPTTLLTVGTVAAAAAGTDPSGLFGAVTGVTTTNGDINLDSAGLVLNQPVTAGTAIVRLLENGPVSQTAAGPITASSLSVVDGVGDVVLEATNAVTTTVAASVTWAGGAFSFNDGTQAPAVGTVTAAPTVADPFSLFRAVTGVTTSNGDINLKSGGLAIDQPLDAGSGTVRLVESGAVSQAAAGSITAGALSVTDSVGNLVLTATNTGTVAASVTSAGGTFTFNDGATALIVGSVAAAPAVADPFSLFSALTGVATNSGAVTLTSGALTLGQSVNAGSAAVALTSAGSISQTGGIITATTLTGSSVGGMSLGGANQVANLGASANAGGGGLLLTDAQALTVTGAVDAGSANLTLTSSGALVVNAPLVAGKDAVLTTTGGDLTILSNITAGSTGNLLATATGATNVTGPIGLNAGSNIVLASNGAFTQSGTLTVKSPDLVIDTTGKNASALLSEFLSVSGSNTITDQAVIRNALFNPSGNSNPITFKGTLAADGSILLLLANQGAITGGSSGNPAITVKQLGVSGTGGTAALFGTIGGNSTNTAAQNSGINPRSDNDYRFNDCVIGSITCILAPGLVLIQPQAVSQVDILVARHAEDVFVIRPAEDLSVATPADADIDAPLINIFDEERLCEQLLRSDPERAKEVCR